MQTNNNFNQLIKDTRIECNLTQLEAANLFNIKERTYWEWENKKKFNSWEVPGIVNHLKKGKKNV